MLSDFLPQLLLITLLALDVLLLSRTQPAHGHQDGERCLLYIVDLGGRAVWCGPNPPALQVDWGGTASASVAGESSAGVLLL